MATRYIARRHVLAAGAALAATPFMARAQTMPLIAYLEPISGSSPTNKINLEAFRKGLAEHGFVEGKNFTFKSWYAEGDIEKLPALAKEVLAHNPAVILASTPNAARPLKELTKTVPVVFAQAADAVDNGEVTNPKRPEANLTGIANFNELNPKRLGWLLEAAPKAQVLGYLADANLGSFERNYSQAMQYAAEMKRKLVLGKAATDAEIEAALKMMGEQGVQALLVGPIRGAYPRPGAIVKLTSKLPVPTMYYDRAFVDVGGLMSFGAAFKEIYRLAGTYVGRILKGEKVADLPVLQPGSYELVVNAATAKAEGVAFSKKVLDAASDVIG